MDEIVLTIKMPYDRLIYLNPRSIRYFLKSNNKKLKPIRRNGHLKRKNLRLKEATQVQLSANINRQK